MAGEQGPQRLSTLVSRVSFEPLSEAVVFPGNGSLSRDGSGASVESTSEYDSWRADHPCALLNFNAIAKSAEGKLVAVFLDYDGTLTPIVSNPDLAVMSDAAREAVRSVAQLFPTAVISGRGREKVQQFVRLRELYYAGSHGMDIVGPSVGSSAGPSAHSVADAATAADGSLAFQPAAAFAPLVDAVHGELEQGVAAIPGATVEHNKFCVSVHFRNCAPDDYPAVVAVVERVAASHPELRITRGRKVLEVRPQVDWDKGAALAHLLAMLGLDDPARVYCLYLGDDRTDEDAFAVLEKRQLGGGILVSTKAKPTAGRWTLRDPAEVAAFLNRLVAWGRTDANRWHTVRSCTGWAIAADAPVCNGGAETPVAACSSPAVAAALSQDGSCGPAAGGRAACGGRAMAAAALHRPPLPPKAQQQQQQQQQRQRQEQALEGAAS